MDGTEGMFAVEETSTSPQATPAAESTKAPAATETTIAPPANQQDVLDTIRKHSEGSGGFELQNGKVVVKRAEAPAAPVTPAQTEQPATEFEDLVVNGETVRVPKSELKSLAQQGYRFTQKTQELSAKTKQVEELQAAVLALMEQQPTGTAPDETDTAAKAMNAVKEKFGKDDPNWEYDPLDLQQQVEFTRSLNRFDQQAERDATKREQQTQASAAREARLSEWENGQRAADPTYNDMMAWTLENIGTPEKPVPRLKQLLNAAEYEVANKAFIEGDTAMLGRVVTFAKKQYQTKKLGLSTRPSVPPTVQSPGNGTKPAAAVVKGDPSELGAMNHDQKRAWIKTEMARRAKGGT